jgi:alanine racemase
MSGHGRNRYDGPELTIDLAAIAANVAHFVSLTAGEVMAVVKADGFGHGATDVANTALSAGASRLGVTSLAEASELRDTGVRAPILSWLNPVDADFGLARSRRIEVAVPSLEHLQAVAGHGRGSVDVHLHADTGMARDGAPRSTWFELCTRAAQLEAAGRIRVIGVMGHLPCADQPDHPSNANGRAQFDAAVRVAHAVGLRPHDLHLAATAATLNDPASHHTMSRIGAGLVGIGSTELHQALTLRAPIVSCRLVAAGTPVGYGHTWTATRPTHLGLIPLGYADGIPFASSGAEVVVRGRRCPVVGRISMDQTVVDLGPEAVRPGEVATVLGGAGPTIGEWAAWAGTLEHEIVTGIGSRVRRTVLSACGELRAVS